MKIPKGVRFATHSGDHNAGRRRCAQWVPWLIFLVVLLQLVFLIHVDVINTSNFQLSVVSMTERWKLTVYSSPRLNSLPRTLGNFGNGNAGLKSNGRRSQELSSNQSFCEAWLEEKDRVTYDRDFSEEPIIVSNGENQVWTSCAIGCVFKSPSPSETADAIFGLRKGQRTVSVLRSMESSSYYPENDLVTARGSGYDVVMTTSLASDVPVGYFSWAEYDLMAPVKEKTEKALATAFISNCGAHNFRLEAVSQLQKHGVTIDSYGSCLRNRHGQVDKLRTLQHYKFSLAFENSNEEDYVTEKYWQSLVAGTVPVVVGAPNIQDFAPATDSILHIKSVNDVANVAYQMKHLASSDSIYNDTLRWKFEGPSDAFKALIDMAVVHSSCRLCIFVGTKLRLEEETMKNVSLSRPCMCKQATDTIYHLYVRERGKFEMESVFLRSSEMTIEGLHHAIISKFESLNYEPVWSIERPKVIKGDGSLRIYRVYPVGMTQRQALYTWNFLSDQDVKGFVKANPCAKIEVIFV